MHRPIVLATVLALAAVVPAGEPPRAPLDEDTLAWFRQARAMPPERLRETLSTLGKPGGLFPKVVPDELTCGLVLGHALRQPERVADLLDLAPVVAERRRPLFYAVLCLAAGPRLRPALEERAGDDATARAVLEQLAERPWPRVADLDPADEGARNVLTGALLVHGDPACVLRYATRLAHADADRVAVSRVLAGAAAMDRSVRDLLHDAAALASGTVRADLAWAVAEADRVHPR